MSLLLFAVIITAKAADKSLLQHVGNDDKTQIILNGGKVWQSDKSKISEEKYSSKELNFINSALELKHSNKGKKEIKLINASTEWGKIQSDSTFGELKYYRKFSGGFVSEVKLRNLIPNHEYMLTLNGKPGLDGNELFPQDVPGNEEEKYYNVLKITTDGNGNYDTNIAVMLLPGDYHARFYVKDTEDWKIVLYHDYFKFSTQVK